MAFRLAIVWAYHAVIRMITERCDREDADGEGIELSNGGDVSEGH